MYLLRNTYANLPASPPGPQAATLWTNPAIHPTESQSIQNLKFYAKVNRANGKPLSIIDEPNEQHRMYLAWMKLNSSAGAEAPTHIRKMVDGFYAILEKLAYPRISMAEASESTRFDQAGPGTSTEKD